MDHQFDVVIRGGLVFDGEGSDPVRADVAISGGRIAEVGEVSGSGREEIDASGKIVTPGFVDIHTHYDAQSTWSHTLCPSSSHGVTTVVMGNCGVGFAPCRPTDRDELIRLMEGVEDIPGAVMAEGLPWNWETFPDYMDAIESVPHDIDLAVMLAHSPLRVYVMGQRAIELDAATPEDMEAMSALAADAMRAGALGFSSSRSTAHRTKSGEGIPSHGALEEELSRIAAGVATYEDRILEFATDFGYSDKNVPAEIGILKRVVQTSGLPMSLSIALANDRPTLGKEIIGELDAAMADGASIKLQVLGRAVGVHLGHELSLSPFSAMPTYQKVSQLPFEEKIAELRKNEVRQKILDEASGMGDAPGMLTNFANMFALDDALCYEPSTDQSIAARAKAAGKTSEEVAYDFLMQRDGRAVLYIPLTSYAEGNLDEMLALMQHDRTLIGLGDGGAHVGMINDAAYPTFMLTHWTRDRQGPQLSLAWIIKAMTSQSARAVGLHDRGVLKPGYKADVNVIDYDNMRLLYPDVLYDLPAGGKRMVQRARGYAATLVDGSIIALNDEPTGATPGRLIRGPQPAPA